MYERILTDDAPSEGQIFNTLGSAFSLLSVLEAFLKSNYDLNRELKYPFGKAYGWG